MGDSEKLAMEWNERLPAPLRAAGELAQHPASRGALPIWLWPNLLSLDAPLVAVAWELVFARATGARVAPATTLSLALAVWLIYVADRLLDTLREPPRQPLAPRHEFYQAHRGIFAAMLVAVSPLAAWLAWTRLDASTFRFGLWMLGAVAVYFGLVHWLPARRRRWFPKELAVAALFAAGCLLPARQGRPLAPAVILLWTIFVLTCWINSSAIELTEWERLRKRQWNPPHRWSVGLARHQVAAGAVLALLAFAAVPLVVPTAAQRALAAVALSALGLGALGTRKDWLRVDAVGVAADFALLAPALLFLLR
jgi:hypothetical protein